MISTMTSLETRTLAITSALTAVSYGVGIGVDYFNGQWGERIVTGVATSLATGALASAGVRQWAYSGSFGLGESLLGGFISGLASPTFTSLSARAMCICGGVALGYLTSRFTDKGDVNFYIRRCILEKHQTQKMLLNQRYRVRENENFFVKTIRDLRFPFVALDTKSNLENKIKDLKSIESKYISLKDHFENGFQTKQQILDQLNLNTSRLDAVSNMGPTRGIESSVSQFSSQCLFGMAMIINLTGLFAVGLGIYVVNQTAEMFYEYHRCGDNNIA